MRPKGTGDGSRSEKSSDEIRELAVNQPTAGERLIINRRDERRHAATRGARSSLFTSRPDAHLDIVEPLLP